MKRLLTFENFRLHEQVVDRLTILKDHLDRTNLDLAQWIITNLGVAASGPLTDQEAIRIIRSVDKPEYYGRLPTMFFFDAPAEDVAADEWLVHFTAQPQAIAEHGFLLGEPNHLKLGMSWGSKSKTAGYNYALTVADAIEKYGTLEQAFYHWQTSGGAIFFKAPAIKVYHFGDAVEQVIFWGGDATHIVPITTVKQHCWQWQQQQFATLDAAYATYINQ